MIKLLYIKFSHFPVQFYISIDVYHNVRVRTLP